jgi:hypothetical protein
MARKTKVPPIKAPMITEAIWINENQAAQINYNLMDGIPEVIDHYIKAVSECIPELNVIDGVLDLNEVWLQTSLPVDLLVQIVKECPIKWPSNVERIQIDKKTFVNRPVEEESQGDLPEQ